MTNRPWTGKCLTCGAMIERESKEEAQSLMDAHGAQLNHDVTVFHERRYSAMAEGFAEGDYSE